jgi:DNA replication ATP-dependent helicase Dna2
MVIDEGSQMPVANASLASRYLDTHGRLTVAGDHLQLPPIITGVYPTPQAGEPKLYGSILECLLRDTATVKHEQPFIQAEATDDVVMTHDFTCKLRENFRMNDSLGRFTQLTYATNYVSQVPDRQLALDLQAVNTTVLQSTTATQQMTLRTIMSNKAALSVLCLTVDAIQTLGLTQEGMATVEANFVCEIYTLFAASSTYDAAAAVSKEIIIVTPHHVQRRAVTQALQSTHIQGANTVLVDTVEKTQGKTADLVIVCYGILNEAELERDFDFLFTPSRLNVSLSRARAKVVMIVGECLVRLPLHFVRSIKAQQGYKLFSQAITHAKAESGYYECEA